MTILVAVDMSPGAAQTVDAVRRTFESQPLDVVVLHVGEPNPEFVGWEAGPDVVRDQLAEGFRDARREVESLAASLREHGIAARGLTVQGATVETILREAESIRADLIAVGSHGHGAAYELAIGSVSTGLIRKATTPVLVVPVRA